MCESLAEILQMKTLFLSNMSKSQRLTSTFFPDKSIYTSIYTPQGDLIHNLGRVSSERQKNVFPWNAITAWRHIQEFQLSHEGMSEVSEQAREWSEQAKRVQQSRALWSERAEWAVQANECSERPSGSLKTWLSVTNRVCKKVRTPHYLF